MDGKVFVIMVEELFSAIRSNGQPRTNTIFTFSVMVNQESSPKSRCYIYTQLLKNFTSKLEKLKFEKLH